MTWYSLSRPENDICQPPVAFWLCPGNFKEGFLRSRPSKDTAHLPPSKEYSDSERIFELLTTKPEQERFRSLERTGGTGVRRV